MRRHVVLATVAAAALAGAPALLGTAATADVTVVAAGQTQFKVPGMGTCNSPTEYVESGTFASGDFRVTETLTLRLVSNVGPDGKQCTDDDTHSNPATLKTYLTTGDARATFFDANNTSNAIIERAWPRWQ